MHTVFAKLVRTSALGLLLMLVAGRAGAATNWHVLAWNNLGMHCMDSSYTIFSVLPPYNVLEVQVLQTVNNTNAVLMRATNTFVVTYEAVADPNGSINRTSIGKSDFWQHVPELFGLGLPLDTGLPVPGPNMYAMPGAGNTPQPIVNFETNYNWLVAYGVPITPYDDAGKPNSYSLLRATVKTPAGVALTNIDAVVPVSDEMDCKACHLSGSGPAAMPAGGWVFDPNPGRDYRLNILLMHDQRFATNALFLTAVAARGFDPAGLYATAANDHHAVLCAACHVSNALPGTGYDGVPALTRSIHSLHAGVIDPLTGLTLGVGTNRAACYRCHPGGFTHCLRGIMGNAVGRDGALELQCMACHGPMSAVGSTNRTGWFGEPNCQACHSGDAVNNGGQIRFTSAYATPTDFSNGVVRVPANRTFATSSNAPSAGFSLFRFSQGHGTLICSACHGTTHAEFPSREDNDNLANIRIQGHIGKLAECDVCHGTAQAIQRSAGPHGLHTIGSRWVSGHQSNVSPVTDCQKCHGTDYRGTVLSRMQGDRTLSANGTRSFWRGYTIGCYSCHNGSGGSGTAATPATLTNITLTTDAGVSTNFALASAALPYTWRIVTQSRGGGVAVTNNQATYIPNVGFSGVDTFTFAANDGAADSTLATGKVTVVARDSVGDGVPDWWRALHFGGDGKSTNGVSAANADPDGDKVNNLGEFLAGTDPLDSRSVLRIFDFGKTGATWNVTFTSTLGDSYHTDRATNLVSAAWSNVSGVVWGHTESTVFGDTNAAAQLRAFYRIAPE